MKGNDMIWLGALGLGAYLLLGGSGGSGGGTEGGGGKKATVLTGAVGTSGDTPTTWEAPQQTPFQPSPYLMDLINQKYSPVETKKATSVATSQYQYGDQLGSKGDGSTNAFDVVAASIPRTAAQAFGTPAKAVNTSWGSSGMSSMTSGGPPAQTPALSALQQKMGVVLIPSSSSSSSKKSSSSGSAPSSYSSSSSSSSGSFSSSAAKSRVRGW